MYPRFDDGNLRIVLAATSAPFAAAVIAASVGARTPARAFGASVLFAALLGIASIMIPAAILSHDHSNEFFVACFFGSFFGAPTGALYGIPLAILAALGHTHVRAATHEATDRGARLAGGWLLAIGLLAAMSARLLDEPKMDWATSTSIPVSPVPIYIALAASVAGLALVSRSIYRLTARANWIARVREGLEPEFRIRAIDTSDRLEGLPRLGANVRVADEQPSSDHVPAVLEWLPEEEPETTDGPAYRTSAYRSTNGQAVAIVSAEAPIVV
jgi:hypothetical protein